MAKKKIITTSDVDFDTIAPNGVLSAITRKVGTMNETVITVVPFTQVVDNANLGFGKKIGTFPKGEIVVHRAKHSLTYSAASAFTVTPVFGLGTVIASGAVAALSGTATFEDVVSGANGTAFNGATEVTHSIWKNGELDIKDGTSTAKNLFLNVAGAWDGANTLTIGGTITVLWSNITK